MKRAVSSKQQTVSDALGPEKRAIIVSSQCLIDDKVERTKEIMKKVCLLVEELNSTIVCLVAATLDLL